MPRPRTGTGGGRKAEPIEKKRLRGARIRNGLPAVPVPEFALATVGMADLPKAPDTLDAYGAAYWSMFWDAGRRHLSEKHDSALIELLCQQVENVARINAWLAKDVTRQFFQRRTGSW